MVAGELPFVMRIVLSPEAENGANPVLLRLCNVAC